MNLEIIIEYFLKFWDIIKFIWTFNFYNTNFLTINITLLIIIISYYIRNIFSKIIINYLKSIAARTKNKIDDIIINALDGPLHLLPIIFGIFISVKYLSLNNDLGKIFITIIKTLIVVNIFWALNLILIPINSILNKVQKIFTKELFNWIFKALRISVIAIGIATILELWGIKVTPIIASFGLIGVAVALGAQDLFKNLIASLTIMSEKRLAYGDWIKIDGIVEGVVENIGFRSTKIRRFDKVPVFVPNNTLANKALINFNQMTNRRIFWKINLLYNSTIPQLIEIRQKIEDYLIKNNDFIKSPNCTLFVRIDNFNKNSINLMIYCFTHTTDWGKWLKIKENFIYEIKRIVMNSGTDFALPSQTIYLQKNKTII